MDMEAIPVEVRRSRGESEDLEADLRKAESLATFMDAQFELGNVKVGADAIIGLVPVVGDLVSLAIGMYPVMIAKRHGLGRVVIARMMMNLGVDFFAGAIPLVGDALDALNKANLKNVALLRKAAEKKRLR
jgi:hypothetical protein